MTRRPGASSGRRLREIVHAQLSDRQYRSGLDLVSSSALNAAAGLAFWFVAARGFDEATVGVNAALISTMAAIENASSLGMKNALIRFIPAYGSRARELVARTYIVTGLAGLVITPTVSIVLAHHVDELSALGSPRGVLAFTLACAAWIVFVLQDAVLVAISRTALIPIANLAYALAKLLLLAVVAISAPKWGIFGAWSVPLVPIIVWVNVVAFRSLRSRAAQPATTPPKGLVRFAGGELASFLLNTALFGLLPIFVLAEFGEAASAFYALAFTIAYNLMLVNSNVATAMLAAAARDEARLADHTRKAIRQMALFVVPGATVVILGAPIGLRLFGESYQAGATDLLRLLSLAAVANIPVATAVGYLRAQRRVSTLFGLNTVRLVLIGGLCVGLGTTYGLDGVGWGWFLGESSLAIALGVAALRKRAWVRPPAAAT